MVRLTFQQLEHLSTQVDPGFSIFPNSRPIPDGQGALAVWKNPEDGTVLCQPYTLTGTPVNSRLFFLVPAEYWGKLQREADPVS